jgi:hypothetical protein
MSKFYEWYYEGDRQEQQFDFNMLKECWDYQQEKIDKYEELMRDFLKLEEKDFNMLLMYNPPKNAVRYDYQDRIKQILRETYGTTNTI